MKYKGEHKREKNINKQTLVNSKEIKNQHMYHIFKICDIISYYIFYYYLYHDKQHDT